MLTESSGLLWLIVNKPEIIFYDFEKRFEASSSVKITMTNRKIKSLLQTSGPKRRDSIVHTKLY